jgi:hypothetical protein
MQFLDSLAITEAACTCQAGPKVSQSVKQLEVTASVLLLLLVVNKVEDNRKVFSLYFHGNVKVKRKE